MNNDVAEPCQLSDDRVFNGVHEWMSQRAWRNQKHVVRMDWLDLVDAISREKKYTELEVSDALDALLHQKPSFIEKVDEGFLVKKKFAELVISSGEARRERDKLARSAGLSRTLLVPQTPEAKPKIFGREGSALNYPPPQPRYPRNPNVVLARQVFPRLCQEAGISLPMEFTWTRLAAGVGQWLDDGLDHSFIRQMMEEFAVHPMARQSRFSLDELFLSRRQKLSDLVGKRRRTDPGNRRNGSGEEYWLRRSSQRHNQGREYWLGRYQ
jgi:hypothetical protein